MKITSIKGLQIVPSSLPALKAVKSGSSLLVNKRVASYIKSLTSKGQAEFISTLEVEEASPGIHDLGLKTEDLAESFRL